MKSIESIIQSNLFNNVCHAETIGKLLLNGASVKIMCPFISDWGVEWLLSKVKSNAKIEVITELSSRGILAGVQDPDVLRKLILAGHHVHYVTSGLHAKLYWVDQQVLITSANLTRNGLHNNFEVGVNLGNHDLSLKDNGPNASLIEYVRNLWNFSKRMTEVFDDDKFEEFKAIKDKYKRLTNSFRSSAIDIDEEIPTAQYFKYQRDIQHQGLIQNDLMISSMFSGFKETDWSVFDHSELELTDENLEDFKQRLTDTINPVLRKFYLQLKYEPIFKNVLSSLQEGFSQNRRLKKHFPTGRYLFLTKQKEGKRANKHIEIPSFIVAMGVHDQKRWIEVRTGVEEINAGGLTAYGENFLRNIKKDMDTFIVKLHNLGKGWYLSHGDYNKDLQEFLPIEDVTKSSLLSLINGYLSSGDISDFSIRRNYYLENKEERELILSSKITSRIAEDFESLIYFFELAHEGMD